MQYDLYNTPDGRTAVRPKHNPTFSTEDLLNEMSANTTLTKADGLAALTYIGEYLADKLNRGGNVTLDGVGTFGISLTMRKSAGGQKVSGNDVELKRITFKAERGLKRAVAEGMTKERIAKEFRNATKPRQTTDERRAAMQELLAEKAEFSAADYQRKTGLGLSTAYRTLAAFVKEGALAMRKFGQMKIYYR